MNRFDAWLHRTTVYPEVIGVAVGLRWLLIFGGTLWFFVSPESDVGSLWLLAGVAVYNAVLTALWRFGLHPPVLLVGIVDMAAILTVLLPLGQHGQPVYLFGLPVLLLALAYGWQGLALGLAGYLIGESALLATEFTTKVELAGVLMRAGCLAIGAVVLATFVERFEKLRAELAGAALHDRVTGLHNRRHFAEELERIHNLAIRGQRAYSVLVIAIEGLDAVVREKGYPAGNQLLRTMGSEVSTAVRLTDLAGRVGEAEFAVALPETGVPAAEQVARKLRDRLQAVSQELGFAVGVADLKPTRNNAFDDGLRAAHAAAQGAKVKSEDRIATLTAASAPETHEDLANR